MLDMRDGKAADQLRDVVRRFCEALVNAPKNIWHPTLVVIDEAHMFAPQVGQAESLGAVIDLATLWRLARGWYAGRLDRGYVRREPAEAHAYFREAGLRGAFWGLDD